jgi:hypothetical protein
VTGPGDRAAVQGGAPTAGAAQVHDESSAVAASFVGSGVDVGSARSTLGYD